MVPQKIKVAIRHQPEGVMLRKDIKDDDSSREQANSAEINAWHQYRWAKQSALLAERHRWLAITAQREATEASERANTAELEVRHLQERTRIACERADAAELQVRHLQERTRIVYERADAAEFRVRQLHKKVRMAEISIEHQRENLALARQEVVNEVKRCNTWTWVAAQNTSRAESTSNTIQQGTNAASMAGDPFSQSTDPVKEPVQDKEEALFDQDEVPNESSECPEQAPPFCAWNLQKKLRLLQQSLHHLLHMPQPVLAELGQLGVNEDIKLEGEVLAQRIQDAIDIVRASCHLNRRGSKCVSYSALPRSLRQELLEWQALSHQSEAELIDEIFEKALPANEDAWKSQAFEKESAIAALPLARLGSFRHPVSPALWSQFN